MSLDTPLILSLRAAVDASPDDLPLRLHLAELLLTSGATDEAVAHVATALQRHPNSVEARALMTRVMARRAGPAVPATSRVGPLGDEPTERHSFNWAAAERQFADITQPRLFDMGDTGPLPTVPHYDVERPRIRLRDVAGMADLKRRLDAVWPAAVRDPRPHGARAAGWRGGLVLYGPPGCGREFLARAMAGEMGARFLGVALSDGLDGWPGGIERVLRDAFASARRAAPCVLFLDGIDAVGQQRVQARTGGGGTRAAVNQLLAELASTQTDEHVLVLAASDHPWDVDPALRRAGRFDRMVLVSPPDQSAREAILRQNLKNRPVRGVKVADLVKRTEDYSAVDLAQLCATAAELALLDSVHTGQVRQIDSRDFEVALAEVRPSTGGWLAAARHVAMFANSDGSYDELHRYLKRRRMV